MPKVQLIEFTGKGRVDEEWHAANILIFTKATRLKMTPELMTEITHYTNERRLEELEYMATTIRSSWEFVDLTFLISDVTRACAQQITRTRTGSYAMQSQRVTNMSSAAVTNPFFPDTQGYQLFNEAVYVAMTAYEDLIDSGAAAQDARGLLPMNVTTNLVAKYNLRAWADLVTSRSSLRTQEEYREVISGMISQTLQAWPWVSMFMLPNDEEAIRMLEEAAGTVTPGVEPGWTIAKAIDLLRRNK